MTHTKRVIPNKEYMVCREAERRGSTTSKSASGEEENWDEEPNCHLKKLHQELNLWHHQEDEWKQMVDQDPHPGSVSGDSRHGTMAATGEDEPINSPEELIGAVGGVAESVAAEHLSDVKWRDDAPLFMFNDENVSKPQAPAAASIPV